MSVRSKTSSQLAVLVKQLAAPLHIREDVTRMRFERTLATSGSGFDILTAKANYAKQSNVGAFGVEELFVSDTRTRLESV